MCTPHLLDEEDPSGRTWQRTDQAVDGDRRGYAAACDAPFVHFPCAQNLQVCRRSPPPPPVALSFPLFTPFRVRAWSADAVVVKSHERQLADFDAFFDWFKRMAEAYWQQCNTAASIYQSQRMYEAARAANEQAGGKQTGTRLPPPPPFAATPGVMESVAAAASPFKLAVSPVPAPLRGDPSPAKKPIAVYAPGSTPGKSLDFSATP